MAAAASTSTREEEQLELQLRLFASYSPAEVVLRYANDPNPVPPDAPEHNEFPGAIGFVDVSGFTALSEKLNKDHGRKGAELLNQCALPPTCAWGQFGFANSHTDASNASCGMVWSDAASISRHADAAYAYDF